MKSLFCKVSYVLSKALLQPQGFHQTRFISLSANDSYRQLIDAVYNETEITQTIDHGNTKCGLNCAMVVKGIGVSIVNYYCP